MFAKARDLMKKPITATLEMSLHEAASIMETHRISTLPVLADNGLVAGVISKTDLIHFGLTRNSSWADCKVGRAMNPAVISCEPRSTLPEVARIMHDNAIHHVMVMQGTTLVGIISSLDLAEPMLKAYEVLVKSASC